MYLIRVYAANGKLIKKYKGKFKSYDIYHDTDADKLKFYDEKENAHSIYYTTGTVIFDEK